MPTMKDNAVNYQLMSPGATLDYEFRWTDWLGVGETITSYTLTAAEGVTLGSDAEDGGVVTFWLTSASPGTYSVRCAITTNNFPARTDTRTLIFRVLDR